MAGDDQPEAASFAERMRRIESLVAEMEQSGDRAALARSRALVQAVLELHGAGFARVLELASALGEPGQALSESLLRDELLASLLLLHDLHPRDLATRAAAALERVRAQLGAQGCTAELLEARDGVVRVRLSRTGHTHGTSGEGLRAALVDALVAAAPDAETIDVEGAVDGPARASLVQLHVPPGAPVRSGGPP